METVLCLGVTCLSCIGRNVTQPLGQEHKQRMQNAHNSIDSILGPKATITINYGFDVLAGLDSHAHFYLIFFMH
jgi:hypothetical protein